MASIADKITDVRNAARPNSARVTSGRSALGVTLACDNLAGWPTASKVHFVTYAIDSNSNPVAGTQLDCYGLVSGNNIGSFTVVDGNDTGNSIGDVVEMLPTAAWGQDLADALTLGHLRTGAHIPGLPLTSPILTTPVITDYTSATHTHASNATGGVLNAANAIQAGTIPFSAMATGTLRLGLGNNTGGGTLTTSYVTYATVTATTHGGVIEIQWGTQMANGNSGADRTFTAQVLCDGVGTGISPASLNFDNPYQAGITTNLFYGHIHNQTGLAAGSHTWVLQFLASAAASVVPANNFLKVTEIV